MRNYITINGKNSNEINGLLIQELPPISKPQIRTEVEEIDGRDGDIVTKLGFAAYDKEFTVGLYKDFDINEIIAYFNSEGTVVFSNESDKYYNYQIIDQIDFERLVRYRTATVRMHCQPFKYSNTEGARTLGNKGTASGEGSFITLDNTPEAQFSKIDPKGNATQTTYSGKNLININATPTLGRTTVSVSGQSVTVTTDAIASTARATFPIEYEANREMTVSFDATCLTYEPTANNTVIVYMRTTGQSDATTQITLNKTVGTTVHYTRTFTPDNDTKDLWFYLKSSNVAGVVSYRFDNVQLEYGSSETAYEPYVGGTASPNPDYPQAVNTVTGENVVKIEGKNLFDLNDINNLAVATNTLITNPSYRGFSLKAQSGATYTISRVSTTATPRFRVCFTQTQPAAGVAYYNEYGSQGVDINADALTSKTFTVPNNMNYIFVYLANNGMTIDESQQLQLELGSTATTYEPYQGQEFEVNLGKNLFDASTATIINKYVNTNGSMVSAQDWTGIDSFFAVQPNTTYTFSATNQGQRFLWGEYTTNAESGFVSPRHESTGTFTTGATTHYVRFSTNSSNATNIQIELGSQATSYSPYFTPIELAKIGNYQDRIYKDEGKWYVEKQVGKVVLDGTETGWGTYAYGTNSYQVVISGLAQTPNDTTLAIADRFYGIAYNDRSTTAGNCLLYSDGGVADRLVVRNTTWTSLADFKTWLASNPTTVYYALATPTTTEITNEALIAQFEALYNQAHAYKGRTHVAAIAQGSNAPHIIEADVQRSSDGNITNNGNIVSKPTLTIYGSGNIGVSLNGYQILEITLGDEEYITIDTAAMEAYKDTLDNLKNRLVNGDYSKFALRPGSNMIEFSGTVSKCVISKYSRWL